MVLVGDFTGGDAVGFDDFLAFATHYRAQTGDAAYDLEFDLDNDGEIGLTDFIIFAEFFGSSR